MRLSELVAVVDHGPETSVGTDPVVTGLAHDSRAVNSGDLYFAIRGEVFDGHDHALAAMNSGASALVVERVLDIDLPQVVVANSRIAMAKAAAAFAGYPSRRLRVVGVTGTNGKTTIVSMLASIAAAASQKALVIGTLTDVRTTPESVVIQQRLSLAADAGTDLVALEVSSHALVQHRVDEIEFAAVVFSNLSTDHLDYHQTMDEYFEAKAMLFDPNRSAQAVVWVGDPYGQLLTERLASVGVARVDEDLVEIEELNAGGSIFVWRTHRVKLPIGGRFNVANALLAAETAVRIGYEESEVVAGLEALPRVRGRFDPVDEGQDFGVLVDYSHTPDGLAGALAAARGVADGRVIVVFGAGGDRDRTKRPMMGLAATQGADIVIVTSDNPRSESPDSIIEDIVAGMGCAPWLVEPDRGLAIAAAVAEANPGDVVLLAGKGHETTQTIGDVAHEFDDHVEAAAALRRLGASRAWGASA